MNNLEKVILLKDLKRLRACEGGLKYFKTNFPDGAQIIDVIEKLEKEKITTEWIFWLCKAVQKRTT